MISNDISKKIIYIAEDFAEISINECGDIEYTQFDELVEEGVTRHTLMYKNNGEDRKIIPVFQHITDGCPFFYMVPCFNYNGNGWGTCNEPKDMERDGKPWIVPSDRIGVPACSIAELAGECIGLFAHTDGASQNSSASIFCKDGRTVQRIYFSHIEYPVVYLRKFVYGEPMIEFLNIARGQTLSFTCYTYNRIKRGEKFAYGGLFDFVNTRCIKPLTPALEAKQINDFNFDFVASLVEKTPEGYLSNMGFLPCGEHRDGDANSSFAFRKTGKYEIGWCGQNITVAEMHIRKYLDEGDTNALNIGMGIIDTWLGRQYPSGVISAHFDTDFCDSERIDSCNEGWLLWKLILCCELLKAADVDVEKYESACKRVAGYYLEYFPHGGFPQISSPVGKVLTNDGCAGTMLMLGFLTAYKYFGDWMYLIRGKEAFDFYYDTFLANSIAAGGALDTYCIDKESAGPVLRSALLIYELSGDEQYIAKAKQVAYYLMSWTYHHDVAFPDGSDCAAVGVRTTGGTSVSTAHQHLDVWGAYYVGDMVKLYELTGNEAFLEQAKILWLFTLQYISDGNMTLHGMTRPRGAQNEAVLHCNWNWSESGKKGQLNDWLVAWVATFQMDAYYALRDTDFFEKCKNN